ncbi:helix-turn-helix domain-containing protein [Ochrobactrum sp. S1502_03]|uniref:helix-turn-helix domain-containing protein n=1 Tax=Ochrobactrum sp. S1502_03 TaxID=3108451 RepID=UPI0037C96676
MPAIPLPFVVALLLSILLIRVFVEKRAFFRPAPVFISACILLMITVGLRWSIDLPWIRFIQPAIASLLPPVAWLCFSRLRQSSAMRAWPHFLLPAAVVFLSAFWVQWHPPIDLILAVVYFGYGAALLRSGSAGADCFERVRLSDTDGALKAVSTVGGLLLFSGIIDLIIAGDFGFYRGHHAALIVGIANMIMLPIIAYAIAVIGRSIPDDENREAEPEVPFITEQDRQIVDMVDVMMLSKKLYRDPDLTLSRLSRRLGIPSRQISMAINRALGRNVSQVVNEYRIRDARRLLEETDLPITAVMFECGFQTKSNFNREFTRVTGATPSDYRRLGAQRTNTERGPMV